MNRRLVALDTETTGLSAQEGHRLIEIGCIELIDGRLGARWERRLNPEREVDAEAAAIHGLRWSDLKDEPRFADIAEELLDFIKDAELVIHNSAFDLGFIDNELGNAGHKLKIEDLCRVHDTTKIARERFPGASVSLDSLCRRFGIDNSMRDKHSALLDAELLAKVWTPLNSRQHEIGLEQMDGDAQIDLDDDGGGIVSLDDAMPIVMQPGAEERNAHQSLLSKIDAQARDGCLWLEMEAEERPKSET